MSFAPQIWSSLTLALFLFGCAGGDATGEKVDLKFARTTITEAADGPAFVSIGDVTGDGKKDLVVSSFGQVINATSLPTGSITIYEQGSDLSQWKVSKVLSAADGVYWPNELELHDIDSDGDLDIFVGTGFLVCSFFPEVGACGGILWFEQYASGWIRHEIVTPNDPMFYHRTVLADLDGDGIEDIISVAESRTMDGPDSAEARWFKGNLTEDRFESTPRVIGPGLGSIPSAYDIDGDNDLDLVSAEFFAALGASFAWYECLEKPSINNPAGTWLRHVIDNASGPSIQFSLIDNLLGDGRIAAVGSNHTNTAKNPPDPWESAVYLFEVPENPTQPWKRTKISKNILSDIGSPASPQAAPGIFGWGDAENDGDIDILVSGDGDPRIFLLEQTARGQFKTWVLDEGIPQAGGMKIHDIDEDGIPELIVTGYENNGIYLYTQDSQGAYPLREAEVRGNGPMPSDIDLDIDYAGTNQGNLIVALFEVYPPTGPPTAYFGVENATFPAKVRLEDVAPGDYTALVFLDSDPFNPQANGPEDAYAIVPVSVPTTGNIAVELSESGGSSAAPEPTEAPGTVKIEINYSGPETGQVIVGVFDSLPPTAPPDPFTVVEASSFPVTVEFPDVPGGQHQVLAFLDLPPLGPTFPGVEDAQASSTPFQVKGDVVEINLTLVIE